MSQKPMRVSFELYESEAWRVYNALALAADSERRLAEDGTLDSESREKHQKTKEDFEYLLNALRRAIVARRR